ncbi:hypothetical protein KKG63_01740 [Patescibacteria group bacterium]|nr:hypothetical protein [Patescibacteria group bacterium]
MDRIKALLKKKKVVAIIFGLCLLAVLLIVLNLGRELPGTAINPRIDQSPPPVVQTAPDLNFIEANPPEGLRETFDTYSQTFFEFSADVDHSSARVSVSPRIAVSALVYEAAKKVLVIEPTTTPWQEGASYIITIEPGLRGVGGEELKQKD